jgi:ParE toxin of type II toxin-antitoxin system, parDE
MGNRARINFPKERLPQRGLCKLFFPQIGRKRDEILLNIRSITFDKYLILYMPIGEDLEILRVVSGYRDLSPESFFYPLPTFSNSLLKESKVFIELTAIDLDVDSAFELAQIQRQLSRWDVHWLETWRRDASRIEISTLSRVWANRIREMAGVFV